MFTKKEKEPQSLSLYSNRQTDAAIRDVVLAADPGAGLDSFRTRPFSSPGEGWERWMVATRKPRTNDWMVFEMEQRGSDLSRAQKPVVSSACFFDALNLCAEFESTAPVRGWGEAAVAADMRDVTYYRDAAGKADIPLDHDGLPHPAANGLPLTEGDFDGPAYAVAARTRGKALPAVKNGSGDALLDGLLKANPAAAQPDGGSLEERIARNRNAFEINKRKQELCAPFRAAAKAADELNDVARRSVREAFGSIDSEGATGFMTLGGVAGFVIPFATAMSLDFAATNGLWALSFLAVPGVFALGGLGALAHKPLERAARQFNIRHKKFSSLVEKLPAGEEKSLAQEFAKASRSVFALEHAALLHKKCVEAKDSLRKLEKAQKRGLSLIGEAGKVMQWPAADTQSLKDDFKQGRFPATGKFLEKLGTQHGALSVKFTRKIDAVMS